MVSSRPVMDAATPLLLLLTGLEFFFAPKRASYKDAISSVSAAGMEAMIGVLWSSVLQWPFKSLRALLLQTGLAWSISSGPWLLLVFAAIDFSYYLGHRAAHQINVCWAGHGVHHSSEEYNLSTALRQGVFEGAFAISFRLFIAFLCDYDTFQALFDVNLCYQFWVHTSMIDKMPWWFEWAMVTPSHHRVHHARNPRYIDRNYGGNFIVWDRLLGTFVPESEECAFGLVHPLRSFNPLVVQFAHLWNVISAAWAAPAWSDKFKIVFYPPGYNLETGKIEEAPEIEKKVQKYDPTVSSRRRVWCLVTFVVSVAAIVTFLDKHHALSTPSMFVCVAVLVLNLTVVGMMLDGNPLNKFLELVRIASSGLLLWIFSSSQVATLAFVAVSAALAWFASREEKVKRN